jgi:ABC-type uncharacterized transport system auxiliary subunit
VPAAQASGGAPVPVTLIVGRFSAPHLYRDNRIVYTTGPLQLGTYEYHRWVEPPTEMLESMLLRLLRDSGRYATVQALRSSARGDYIVRGRLMSIEEVSSNPLAARAAFEVELFDVKSGKTVWSQTYSHDEPVSGKDVSSVVEAMNRNVQRGLEQMVAGIHQYFASNPPK